MYCCVTRLLQSGVEIVLKKIGHEQSGGQIVKSQEISVFIMLSCWISSSNWNHLSRPKLYPDTYSLQILSLNSSYAMFKTRHPMYCNYPLDNESTLEINLTNHLKISTLF